MVLRSSWKKNSISPLHKCRYMKLLMDSQLRYGRFWRCRSCWEAPLWVWPQLHSNGNDHLGVIRDAVAAQGKAWKYSHFHQLLASRHFYCRAEVEQNYFKAHSWGVVLPRSLSLRGWMTWQIPLWARMGQGRFKTPQQLHALLRMVSAVLDEICLERKHPVPNYLLFGEQRVQTGWCTKYLYWGCMWWPSRCASSPIQL